MVATSMDGVVATGCSPWIPLGAVGLEAIEEEERQFAIEAGMAPPWPRDVPAKDTTSGTSAGNLPVSKTRPGLESACTDGASKQVSGASSAPSSTSSSSSWVSCPARDAAAVHEHLTPPKSTAPKSRIEARGPEWTVFLWRNSGVTSEGRPRVRVELMRHVDGASGSSVTSGKGSVAAPFSGHYSVGSFARCVSAGQRRDSTPSTCEEARSSDSAAAPLVGQVVSLSGSEQATGGSAASECDECDMVRPPAACALRVTVSPPPFASESVSRGAIDQRTCKASEGVEKARGAAD